MSATAEGNEKNILTVQRLKVDKAFEAIPRVKDNT